MKLTRAITEFDMENRFRVLAAKGNRKRGLDLLDKLDAHFGTTHMSNSLHEDIEPFDKGE